MILNAFKYDPSTNWDEKQLQWWNKPRGSALHLRFKVTPLKMPC